MSTDTQSSAASNPLRKRTKEDFEFGKVIGEGSYSRVIQAKELSNSKLFAVKVLSKSFIVKEKKIKYVNVEKECLTKLGRHPNMVKMHYTFQCPRNLYFVLDYLPNGDLLYYLIKLKTLPPACIKFYLAELCSVISYIHSKGIIHRDLKPENILLDDKMHLRLTDFGSAKILTSNNKEEGEDVTKQESTSSFVGSACFVSPELLKEKKIDRSTDLWAIGCIAYRMMVGELVFKSSNDYQTFQNIINLNFTIPEELDSDYKLFINQLLIKDSKARLGYNSFEEFKNHSLFSGIDFDTLHKQTPPSMDCPPPKIGEDDSDSDEFFK
ncbi:phosphoinositide-dependent kinase-1 [Conidiobolus coronatus NRRL 28638]|uniref:non-specific serine/threonine protein kinase n=1 Tax=Conidiobolus coronatus (strain ATCC 28846 / CBS 209.66 / NRRL 28638) TaxID=796925 RepID=A0A137P330_CONC2|nr:phosphoinositide-dependent kinase-1 [Conidiobolus coronatus NRRL 28638]|eukprot:KXN69423.1 phosphoinositide-dependent kinase-1 [Conidiobolus coronatus NRRL 28638]